jgi:hypothetical protein
MPEYLQGCVVTTAANDETCIRVCERRRQPRQMALLRVALLHGQGANDICLVKNLSANGLSARAYRKLAVDEPIEIEFRSGELFAGSVIWERNWEFGLAFPQPIDVATILGSRWVTENSKRRALPRIAVDCDGQLSDGFRTIKITLRDISQGGASVQASASMTLMSNVVLTLPNLPLLTGVVRWNLENALGIAFNECVAFERLAQWIHARRELASAGGS